MDGRLGLKDVLVVGLLLVLLGLLALLMVQNDRQWAMVRDRLDALETAGPARIATTAPPASTDESYAQGDWFVSSFGVDVGTLNPLTSADVYGSLVQEYVLESLADLNPRTLEYEPLLAESWDISDDGLTIGFDLRPDAVFSDGEPVTADDVVFTYELILNPRISADRQRAYYDRIQAVTAEGDHRVVFTFDEPYFRSFELCAGMQILAEHYYSDFSEEQINDLPGLLFGSGPYKLPGEPEDWRPGGGPIELVRNENYWGPAPALDRFVWRVITDPTSRSVAFTNAELDYYSPPEPTELPQLLRNPIVSEDYEFNESDTINTGYRFIGWNQARGPEREPTPFADKRVRQAMTMLIDRQGLADELMRGRATVATGPFHWLNPQADPDIEPWPYDPQRARELLAEAGYVDRDDDGVLEDAEGDPLRFTLTVPSSSTNYLEMAQRIRDSMLRAGVQMEVDPTEWNTLVQRLTDRQFDAISLGWSAGVESDPYQIFHSEMNTPDGDNNTSYENPELDALITEARSTMDRDQRMPLWNQVHRILHEDQPYTFLFTQRSQQFLHNRIRGDEYTPLGLNGIDEWWVPAGQQLRGQ